VNYQFWRYAAVDADLRSRLLAEWNRPTWWPVAVFLVLFVGAVALTVVRGRRR
jgi:hypothetical protein